MNKNIIIFGATGHIGVEVCKELEKNNLKHTVFIKKGTEEKLKSTPTHIAYGDLLQFEKIHNLISEQKFTDVIIAIEGFCILNTRARSKRIYKILKAINLSQKKVKVHMVSTNGVGDSWKNLSWCDKLCSSLYIGKSMKEYEFRENMVQTNKGGYHIIRPVGLTNKHGTDKYIVQLDGKLPNTKVSRTNVASYLVNSMLEETSGTHFLCDA